MGNTRTSPRTWLIVGGLLAVGFWLRVQSLGFGLPDVYHPDETPILNRALTFAKGDPNPHNFLYPTLYLYATFLWEGAFFVVGRLLGWYDSLSSFQRAYFVDPSGHFLAARLLTAICGTLTILAVYWFGSRLYNRDVGLTGALFMAVAPFAVRDSHYVKLDVPVALGVAIAHALLATIVVDPRWAERRRAWIAAGLAAGLAVSTQYYAAFVVVPIAAAAVGYASQSGDIRTAARLLTWAALGTIAGFCLGSPFFIFEWSSVVRDFQELHKVDIERAVTVGAFSSLGRYLEMLALEAVGWPVFILGVVGLVAAWSSDWRRAMLLTAFPLAFLAFLANTYPVSRYINAMMPIVTVAAAYAVVAAASAIVRWRGPTGSVDRTRLMLVAGTVAIVAAVPGFAASMRWNRFLGQDDTRAIARRFVEREIPAGTAILLQPHSVQLRVTREALVEALQRNLGDARRASAKFQLQLAAQASTGVSYAPVFLGRGLDADKIYLDYQTASDLSELRRRGIRYVILKTHRGLSPAAVPLVERLDREARLMTVVSPYRPGIDPAATDAPPPFLHNTDARVSDALARPGPIISVWQLRDPR